MARQAIGRQEKLFVVPETTFGTAASAPASGNAIRFMEANFAQAEERIYRTDKRSTRSYLETIVKKVSVQWSLKGYLLPSGAAGTAPDGWDDIFESAFGTETVNASTSVVYSLAKEFEKPLTFHRGMGSSLSDASFGEMIRGGVVNQLTFNLDGTSEAMVSASGFAADILRAGVGTISTDSGTLITFSGTGEAHNFDAGIYVDVDSVTDQLISAVNTTGNTITVPSHTAQSNGEFVVPSAVIKSQSFVSTAVPISGILGSCTLESTSFTILGAEITLNNGAKVHLDHYGTSKADGYHQENRSVEGSLRCRLDATTFNRVAKSRRSSKIALSLVAGTAAGSIATFTMSNVIIDYSPIPSSAEGDIFVTLPFKAYASSSLEDELVLTFT